ncbi:hypothetical protein DSL92_05490 [Billgrantia gudaonensis]|uniref:Uncharacterized protein n=1 Tax=Billgrantia gudaonensis TaxID=376427 RepID=A0A3S0NET3_9GAMM|nr:hypothetical protein DSL92_05490 [Halomonas gudaonensis]
MSAGTAAWSPKASPRRRQPTKSLRPATLWWYATLYDRNRLRSIRGRSCGRAARVPERRRHALDLAGVLRAVSARSSPGIITTWAFPARFRWPCIDDEERLSGSAQRYRPAPRHLSPSVLRCRMPWVLIAVPQPSCCAPSRRTNCRTASQVMRTAEQGPPTLTPIYREPAWRDEWLKLFRADGSSISAHRGCMARCPTPPISSESEV